MIDCVFCIVYELWAYESFDEAIAVNDENKEWKDTGNEFQYIYLSLSLSFKVGQAVLYTKESYAKGLLPIDISPLK